MIHTLALYVNGLDFGVQCKALFSKSLFLFSYIISDHIGHSILLIMRVKVNIALGTNSSKFGTNNLNIYSIFKYWLSSYVPWF